MRSLLVLALLCGSAGCAFGQISFTLDTSPTEPALGQTVTITARLTNLSDYTTVNFYDTPSSGDVLIGTADVIGSGATRTASISKNNIVLGSHVIKATSCAVSNGCLSATVPLVVSVSGGSKTGTAITLTSSPNPSIFGEPVTLTAKVTPLGATNNVAFFDRGSPLGGAPLINGVATLIVSAQTTGALAVGTHILSATYNGDNFYNSNFSKEITQVVNTDQLTISSIDPDSAAVGSGAFFMAIFGTGFTEATVVQWNGAGLLTTFISPTILSVIVDSNFVATPGTATVKVVRGATSSNGVPFSVNPPGQPCNFTFSNFLPANLSFAAAGGSGKVLVTASRGDCSWTPSSSAGFLTLGGGAMTGSVTLNYNVAANAGSTSRSAKVTIGAQSFTVIQGSTNCLFSLPATTQAFGPDGGNGTAFVEATPGCAWSASSSSPLVPLYQPDNGAGNGLINYAVALNPSASARSITITIANQPFTVIQAGSGSNAHCTAAATSAPVVAQEGLTEAVGGIAVNCSGVTGVIQGDLVLTLNTNVTNNPLLSVNGGPPQSGIVSGYNVVRFPSVSLSPTGSGTVNLGISQILANANIVGLAGGTAQPVIQGQVAISSLTPVPVDGGQLTLATVAPSLVFTRIQATPPTGGVRTLVPLIFGEARAGSFQANATRLRVALTNIPANAQVFAPVFPMEGANKAQLYSADSTGAGGSPLAGSSQPEGTYQQLTVTGGRAAATWVVLAANAGQVETWTFPLLVVNASATDFAAIQLTSSLAPVSDVNGLSFTAPVPRYRDFAVPQKLVNLRLTTSISGQGASGVTITHKLLNDTSDPSQGATNATIRDTLPSGLILKSCTATAASCTVNGNSIEVVEDSLPPAAQAMVSVNAQVDPSLGDGVVLENPVTVSSDQITLDLGAATASASIVTTGGVSGGGPTVVGPSPAFGSGLTQNFSIQFSNPSGFQNLGVVNILINNFLDGRNACYLAYEVGATKLSLVDDLGRAGGPFAGQVILGSSSTIQNSQCIVTLLSAPGSGNILTLNLTITFKPSFGGNKIVFSAARDQGAGNSDWQTLGVWQVPFTPTGAIAVAATTPSRDAAAAGIPKSFLFRVTDTNGAGDVGIVNVLINNFIDGRRACFVAYIASSNTLVLVNDGGDAGGPFAGSMLLNGAGNGLENSQCKINASGSSAALTGNTLNLNLNITFKGAFAGNRVIYVAGRDHSDGNNTDWQASGTFTVQ